MSLAPFPVVVPLLAAAFLSATSNVLPRRAADLLATSVAAAVLGVSIALAIASTDAPVVYWFGGWAPRQGLALGISFAIDPAGAGLAAFVAFLVVASFLFSWRYFESVKTLFHALMLVFLAAMCGLALTGDLFNLFVWFELMSAAGVTLCGYESEEAEPVLGAINFAVLNTLGAFLSLTGVAFLYARTGALNMAQAGAALAAHPPGTAFLLVALVFFASGFLVKAAAVPFHFWLDDAHAVAPTPVCILFSGVMVELGVYAIARVWWVVFAPVLAPSRGAVEALLLDVGVATALIGAVSCFGQRHLKRLLAFSTVSHVGILLLGLALLDPAGLSAAAIYLIGHGAVKAMLFVCAGILLNRFASVDEQDLHGRGRELRFTGLLMFLGALGLAGMPPFGTFYGAGGLHEALAAQGLGRLVVVVWIASALTAAAVLRVTMRVFLGWGERDAEGGPRIELRRETDRKQPRTPASMWAAGVLLLAVALGIGASSIRGRVQTEAGRMVETSSYTRAVLEGKPPGLAPARPATRPSALPGLLVPAAALVLALLALRPTALGRAGTLAVKALARGMQPVRAVHSGRVGDYVAWFVFGVAAYGGYLVLATRG